MQTHSRGRGQFLEGRWMSLEANLLAMGMMASALSWEP
jgi:hypothetical protein